MAKTLNYQTSSRKLRIYADTQQICILLQVTDRYPGGPLDPFEVYLHSNVPDICSRIMAVACLNLGILVPVPQGPLFA